MTINEPARIHQQREWRASVASQLDDLIDEYVRDAGAGTVTEIDALVGRMLHEALDKAGVQLAPRTESAWSTDDGERVEQLWLNLVGKLGATIDKQTLAHGLELARMVLAKEPPAIAPIETVIALNIPQGTSVAAIFDELGSLPNDAVTTSRVMLKLIAGQSEIVDEEPF